MSTKGIDDPDAVVIGAGPAGLAAAASLKKNGIARVLLVERNSHLGGILPQCIHEGFGLVRYREVLTGPEYAQREIDELKKRGVKYMLDTMVLSLDAQRNMVLSNRDGLRCIRPKVVILAMGCRERTTSAIRMTGTRPSGVYTAGTAQNLINIGNCMVGRRAVVMGSGDIGLIMARRLTLEGAKVEAVVEIMPYPGGLKRNVVQCLEDYDIPLILSHSVTKVLGKHRVEGVKMVRVDEDLGPIQGTEKTLECDTLLVSVGLIPENELSKTGGVDIDQRTSGAVVKYNLETSVPGIFACGNVLHVHDLVDYASMEGDAAGERAAERIKGKKVEERLIKMVPGKRVRYVVPHLTALKKQDLYLRADRPIKSAEIEFIAEKGGRLARRLGDVIPSEMIKISVKIGELCRDNTSQIKVRIKEGEE